MINQMAVNGNTTYGVKEFVLDSVDDVDNLPTEDLAPGSVALIVADSSVYILNNNREWKEI